MVLGDGLFLSLELAGFSLDSVAMVDDSLLSELCSFATIAVMPISC